MAHRPHAQQPQAALAALDKAPPARPRHARRGRTKGRAYSQLKRWDQAIKHLQAYRDLLGDETVICHELGLAPRNSSRFPEAARVYRAALDLDPKDAAAFNGLLMSLTNRDNRGDLGEPLPSWTTCASISTATPRSVNDAA